MIFLYSVHWKHICSISSACVTWNSYSEEKELGDQFFGVPIPFSCPFEHQNLDFNNPLYSPNADIYQ